MVNDARFVGAVRRLAALQPDFEYVAPVGGTGAVEAAARAAREQACITRVAVRTELVRYVEIEHAVDDEDAIERAIGAVDDPIPGDGWELTDDYSNSEVVQR